MVAYKCVLKTFGQCLGTLISSRLLADQDEAGGVRNGARYNSLLPYYLGSWYWFADVSLSEVFRWAPEVSQRVPLL
jgi:hypothetical protein